MSFSLHIKDNMQELLGFVIVIEKSIYIT